MQTRCCLTSEHLLGHFALLTPGYAVCYIFLLATINRNVVLSKLQQLYYVSMFMQIIACTLCLQLNTIQSV